MSLPLFWNDDGRKRIRNYPMREVIIKEILSSIHKRGWGWQKGSSFQKCGYVFNKEDVNPQWNMDVKFISDLYKSGRGIVENQGNR